MIAPPGNEGLPGLETWMEQLQANGGNYIRVWLSNPFFDVEHVRCGDYDEANAKRIEALLAIAARHGIRVKIWHWDYYVARQNLWWHFGRFAEAIKDLDPPAEQFQPEMLPHPRLRVYALKGQHTALLWCRDVENTWRRELGEGRAPDPVQGAVVDVRPLNLGNTPARFYDPWENRWTSAASEGDQLRLPAFKRSLVVRFALGPAEP